MIDKAAKDLARNPLGIIALFIVLVYGIAALAMGLTSTLSEAERMPMIWFLVGFPVLVLMVFCWLVSRHHEKLYAPGDYKSDEGFLSAAKVRRRHVADLEMQQKEVKAIVRDSLQKSSPPSSEVESIIADVQGKIDKVTTITVDARDFTCESNRIRSFPIAAFESFDSLTNEIYFNLIDVKPFHYGNSWVLRNLKTNEIVQNMRMIQGTKAGTPLTDLRTLADVGISAGTTLRVERP